MKQLKKESEISAINEIRNRLDVPISRLEEAEELISDLEDRVMESNQAEQKREKRTGQNKNRLRKLSDNIKHNKIHIIGVPKEEERKSGQEIYLKK